MTKTLPKYYAHQGDDYLEIVSQKSGMVLMAKYPSAADWAEAIKMVKRLNE